MRSRPFTLSAVTICINYGDYLAGVAENGIHFDRWIIVTVPDDLETQAVCRKHRLECHITHLYGPGGASFRADYNKAAGLNEALDRLDQTGWCVVLDADVLLPMHFRSRLESMPLIVNALYGLKGRRACLEPDQFNLLRGLEPWDALLSENSGILGYFNLFNLETELNRYVVDTSADRGTHDDFRFAMQFKAPLRRFLPMGSLHAGEMATNWTDRKSAPFVTMAKEQRRTEIDDWLKEPVDSLAPGGRAVVIGIYPAPRRAALFRWLRGRFETVTVVDHFGLTSGSVDPLVQADTAALRRELGKDPDLGPAAAAAIPHDDTSISAIPDGSVSLLILDFEPTLASLMPVWAHWRAKLGLSSIVAGTHFSHYHFPDAAFGAALQVNAPFHVTRNGFWTARLRRHGLGLPPCGILPPGQPGQGIVVEAGGADDGEAFLLKVMSIREWWQGPVSVIGTGEFPIGGRLFAGELGADVILVPALPRTRTNSKPSSQRLPHYIEFIPYHTFVFVGLDAWPFPDMASWFQELSDDHVLAAPAREPALSARWAGLLSRWTDSGILTPEEQAGVGASVPVSLAAFACRRDAVFLSQWLMITSHADLIERRGPDFFAPMTAALRAGRGIRGLGDNVGPEAIMIHAEAVRLQTRLNRFFHGKIAWPEDGCVVVFVIDDIMAPSWPLTLRIWSLASPQPRLTVLTAEGVRSWEGESGCFGESLCPIAGDHGVLYLKATVLPKPGADLRAGVGGASEPAVILERRPLDRSGGRLGGSETRLIAVRLPGPLALDLVDTVLDAESGGSPYSKMEDMATRLVPRPQLHHVSDFCLPHQS